MGKSTWLLRASLLIVAVIRAYGVMADDLKGIVLRATKLQKCVLSCLRPPIDKASHEAPNPMIMFTAATSMTPTVYVVQLMLRFWTTRAAFAW